MSEGTTSRINEEGHEQSVLGIDLGSHVIRLGKVTTSSQVERFRREPYTEEATQSGRALVDQLRRVVKRTIDEQSGSAISGIGIAIPGLVHAPT